MATINSLGKTSSTHISVHQLAEDYAKNALQEKNLQLDRGDGPLLLKRYTYNAKVTAFNAATMAVIATIALTILSNSIFWAVLSAGSFLIRDSIDKSIRYTGAEEAFEGAEDLDVAQRVLLGSQLLTFEAKQTQAVMEELQIDDAEWKMNQYKVLDFVVWRNFAPQDSIRE